LAGNEPRPWLSLYPDEFLPDLNPKATSVLDHLQRAVEGSSHRPAIYYFFDKVISYRELDEMSDAFACALIDLGVGKGDRVALYLQNVPQFLIAQYGVWKAGGIVVPLNPMFKKNELAFYFRDAGIRVLIALQSLHLDVAREVVGEAGVEHVITTSELDFLDKHHPLPPTLRQTEKLEGLGTCDFMELLKQYHGQSPPAVSLSPEDTAYLSYTPGTTGPPKGAMKTHLNVVFNAEAYLHCWKLGPSDVILGVAPLFHITGLIASIGATVAAGVPLALFYNFDSAIALRMIERWKVTNVTGAITVYIAMLNDPEIGQRDFSSRKLRSRPVKWASLWSRDRELWPVTGISPRKPPTPSETGGFIRLTWVRWMKADGFTYSTRRRTSS